MKKLASRPLLGRKSRGDRPMTVCIAAICTWEPGEFMIVGAADRMLSAHDIKFEPPQKKIYKFYDWAVALAAGDPYAQIEICDEVARVFALKPPKTVRDIAVGYAEAFSGYRRLQAETRFLKPLGLDANSFMDRSQDFRSDLVSDLKFDMQRLSIEAEAIIAGQDATGPHLFVITDPGQIACADSVAFASIGSGKNHADSHFMMAHHTRLTPAHQALLQTYVAKRRAEVSPTVGGMTDLFFIGRSGFQIVSDEIHDSFKKIYSDLEERTHVATAQANREATKFIDSFLKRAAKVGKADTASKAPNVPSKKTKSRRKA